MTKNRGFTLLEMIVTLSLVAILFVSMGSTKFNALKAYKIRAAASSLKKTIHYAYSLSVFNQKKYCVNLNTEINKYSILNYSEKKQVGKMKKLPANIEFSKIVVAGQECKKGTGNIKINFYPQGYCDSALIHIRDASNRSRMLEISSLGGKVIIQ